MSAKRGKDEEEEMEVGEEEEEEEVTEDFGPDFDPQYFEFLTTEKPDEFYEGDFDLVRPFKVAVGFLDNPHGSVKLYQGDTCVICAVYGPSEVRMSKELPHRAAIDILFRPKITGTSQMSQLTGWDSVTEERAVEMKLNSILESVIFLEDDMGAGFNIILHEFENDGCVFSACVNATSLALMNAGCSLRCIFAAVTVLISENKSLIVDPSLSQINNGWEALLTFVFTNDGQVLYSGLQGKANQKLIRLCLLQAQKASVDIFKFQRLIQSKECAMFASTSAVKLELQTSIKIDENEVKVKSEPVDKLDEVSDDENESEESVEEEEEEGEVQDVSSGSD